MERVRREIVNNFHYREKSKYLKSCQVLKLKNLLDKIIPTLVLNESFSSVDVSNLIFAILINTYNLYFILNFKTFYLNFSNEYQ